MGAKGREAKLAYLLFFVSSYLTALHHLPGLSLGSQMSGYARLFPIFGEDTRGGSGRSFLWRPASWAAAEAVGSLGQGARKDPRLVWSRLALGMSGRRQKAFPEAFSRLLPHVLARCGSHALCALELSHCGDVDRE